MDERFNGLAARRALLPGAARDLHELGFAVIRGPISDDRLADLAEAYEMAVATADPQDVGRGTTTTRVHDLVNRGPVFDDVYVFPPLLDAGCRVLGRPFKLSTLLARTLHPGTPTQPLHVDFPGDALGWTMVGFILMVDPFRPDNGATAFTPGSHRRDDAEYLSRVSPADDDGHVLACGPAGSMIVYNGSVWHGHTANTSGEPRRSIQGAFVRRDARPAIDLPTRMRPDTLARIGPFARYVLGLDAGPALAGRRPGG